MAFLLIFAPFIGALSIWQPILIIILVSALGTITIVSGLINVIAIRRFALAVVALIIIYPAFLPRSGTSGATLIGELGSRQRIHVVVILVIALAAMWCWFSIPGTIAIFTRAPLNWLAWYGGVIALSLTYTPDQSWAAFAAVKLYEAIIIIAVLAVIVRTLSQLRLTMNVMLAAVAVVMAVFWIDIWSGNVMGDETARLRTTWLHPNSASLIALTFASIMIARFFTAVSPSKVLAAGALACFGVLTGFMTGGKTALVGGFLALVVTIAVTIATRIELGRSRAGRTLLVVLALALLIVYVAVSNIGIAAHLRAYNESKYREASNLTGRVPLWSIAVREGLTTPILGHGYMSTFALLPDNGLGWEAGQMHNSFIQTFFDLGLVGLIVVIMIYAGAWRSVVKQVMARDRPNERWRLSVELLAALTVLTINSLTEDVFGGIFEIRTMLFLLVIFAIHQNSHIIGSMDLKNTVDGGMKTQLSLDPPSKLILN